MLKSKNINMQHITTVIRTALVIYNAYKDDADVYSNLEIITYDSRNTDVEYLQKKLNDIYANASHNVHDNVDDLRHDAIILLCSQMKMLNMVEREIVVKLVQKGIVNVANTSNIEKFIKERFAVMTQEEKDDPTIQLMIEMVK